MLPHPGARAEPRAPSIRDILIGAPPDTVSLALGEPGWSFADDLADALAAAPLRYGPNAGESALIDLVAARHAADPGEVLITAGAQAALFTLFQSVLGPQHALLLPDPGFPGYAAAARGTGARPVGYPLAPGGHLDADLLLQTLAQTPGGRVVVLNHPGNPTGGPASAAALRRIVAACDAAGVMLVSDEVYRELAPSPAPSLRTFSDRAVVVDSVSKAWAAPGLRVGWIAGPAEVVIEARVLHTAMTSAAARPSQYAAVALLRASEHLLPRARAEIARRWDLLHELTVDNSPLAPTTRAGFYHWVPAPGARGRTWEWARWARDRHGVAVVPGTAFGARGDGYLRVSIGGPLHQVRQGWTRLLHALDDTTDPTHHQDIS